MPISKLETWNKSYGFIYLVEPWNLIFFVVVVATVSNIFNSVHVNVEDSIYVDMKCVFQVILVGIII